MLGTSPVRRDEREPAWCFVLNQQIDRQLADSLQRPGVQALGFTPLRETRRPL